MCNCKCLIRPSKSAVSNNHISCLSHLCLSVWLLCIKCALILAKAHAIPKIHLKLKKICMGKKTNTITELKNQINAP